MRDCNDCGAKPNTEHVLGCDVERCRLCGGQAISCSCASDIDCDDQGEPSKKAWKIYDAEVAALGGRLKWSGEYPNADRCREFGFWCKWVDGKGWVECEASDPGAKEDLNKLMIRCLWNRQAGRFDP